MRAAVARNGRLGEVWRSCPTKKRAYHYIVMIPYSDLFLKADFRPLERRRAACGHSGGSIRVAKEKTGRIAGGNLQRTEGFDFLNNLALKSLSKFF